MPMPKPHLLFFLCFLGLCCLGACADAIPGPLDDLPVAERLPADVDAAVQIIRDEHGIPHLYGRSMPDVAYAQGYVMAQDRLVQMDLLRHYAAGTLAELFGALDPSFIDEDIAMRVHRLRATAEQVWQALQQSSSEEDRLLTQVLVRFSAGVNAYLTELKEGRRRLPAVLALAADPALMAPWTPVDSLSLARLQAFNLSFDPDSEIARTQAEAAAYRVFDQAGDPRLRSRRGLSSDLFRHAPLAPAFILPDALSCGARSVSPMGQGAGTRGAPARALLDLAGLDAALSVGAQRRQFESRGSNNWVVAPRHTASGLAMLANDTHLSLSNPPIFYLQHLQVEGQMGIMGVQFPGLPGVVLGMNERLVWGSTTTNADVTDVYEERILSCGGAPCVEWRDPAMPDAGPRRVPLVRRSEEIAVGRFGQILQRRMVTFYEVPHHGPLLPRIVGHDAAPPGPVELSVRYTGYRPSFEIRAVFGVARARTAEEGMAAIERDFRVGSQNWIFADADGHIGYTSHVDLPARPPESRPWVVQPGDGSAEWRKEGVPAGLQPRALDPACGMIVTANNDPLGATSDNPAAPIYHGWDYDVGARAGRITARLRQEALSSERLTLSRMQDIQADHRSFLGALLAPFVIQTAEQLLKEAETPGTFADLTQVARGLDPALRGRLQQALARLRAWRFGTPAGLDHEASPAEVEESIATTLFNVWLSDFHVRTLADEFQAIDEAFAGQKLRVPRPGSSFQRKLLVTAVLAPDQLAVGRQAPGGDSLLFDDLRTRERTETRREIAARSLVAALTLLPGILGDDMAQWRWGRLHRLTLDPLLPIAELKIPAPRDEQFASGVPRHGDLFAVDVASFGVRYGTPMPQTDYTYGHGAAIRFVAEIGREGPRAVNVLPGGQTFDPDSRHYADQFALWRHNRAIPLPFAAGDVAASAVREAEHGGAARVELVPRH